MMESSSHGEVSDRFSDLPRDVFYRILSFLDIRDLISSSMPSKSFMSWWQYSPVLDFDHNYVADTMWYEELMSADEFVDCVHYIIRRRSQQAPLQKFRLSVDPDSEEEDELLDRIHEVISFAVNNGVKELVLHGRYPLPHNIVFANSVTSLTLSRVEVDDNLLNELLLGCPHLENLAIDCPGINDFKVKSGKIKSVSLIGNRDLQSVEIESTALQFFAFECWPSFDKFLLSNCNFLKELDLDGAPITDDWIEKFLPGLLLLERFELKSCDEYLKKIKVCNPNLKRICVEKMWLEEIVVRVTNLESFFYRTMSCHLNNGYICNINIVSCKHLRNLTLYGCGIPENFLQEQVSKLLELERLELDFSSFERLDINHKNLKHLLLCNSMDYDDIEVKIHTPGLVLFSFEGSSPTPFTLFHYSANLHARLRICRSSSFKQSYELVRCLGQCKVLTFDSCDGEELIFPQELRSELPYPLFDLRHMIVDCLSWSCVSVELVDSLLWLSPHLDSLVCVGHDETKIILSIKFEYEWTANTEDNALGSSHKPVQCYSLRKVDMEIFEDVEETDNLLKYFKDEVKSMKLIKW